MEPTEFVNFAEELLRGLPSTNGPQVILRTAMNRAYLGALMMTEVRLSRIRGRAHPRDMTFYGSVESDLEEEMPGPGHKLATLRKYRNDADYDLATDITRRESEQTVRSAASYVTEVQEKLV